MDDEEKVSSRHEIDRRSASAGAVPLQGQGHGDEHGQGGLFPLEGAQSEWQPAGSGRAEARSGGLLLWVSFVKWWVMNLVGAEQPAQLCDWGSPFQIR